MDTLTFMVGKDSNNKEPKSYIKKLLSQNSCSEVQKILNNQNLSSEQQKDVHTFWTVCGHRVREKLKDDLKLENILKNTLPKYTGKSITLYRGENSARYNRRYIGFCWTTKKEIAEMFARVLNSKTSGGILLQYSFTAK